MSEEKTECGKQDHNCPEEQEWNDTAGKCMPIQKTVKTIDTQIEDLLKERDERNKQELLSKMKSKVLEEEKAREQDRIGEAEKKIGGLEAKFNDMMGKLAVFLAKFDELGKRMTKMEETPDLKPTVSQEEKSKDVFGKLTEIAEHSRSFEDGWDEVEETAHKRSKPQ